MRHRVAGNRIGMPESRRRAAFRSLIDGLVRYEHVKTTDARAKAVKGMAEDLIAKAVRGTREAQARLRQTVTDENQAQQILAIARRASFKVTGDLPSNEERAQAHKLPLTEQGRAKSEERMKAWRTDLSKVISDPDKAQEAIDAAREAIAIELHARRILLKELPEIVVKKVFDELVPRYSERPGGYTRITKLGRRLGDAAEMVVLELV